MWRQGCNYPSRVLPSKYDWHVEREGMLMGDRSGLSRRE